ncbi:hypothetical protein EUTSA_v10006099mg [Eutrema salsugineum]|uniref:Protein kinase domain-containing protein n=1 Tax=Eutrema salsugineum TaxID=72664 RepID=V4L1Z1_EUTSA|nr:non-functional pseudokinase ZED1 [Eutrema salsugineum]XP_024012871.1 non-functional pseudokinase ZED1 [Eutrema salsugineum]ESQ44300.1 hypothetical protein EUTSA_v10006099mg [Eutrema salsugineum]
MEFWRRKKEKRKARECFLENGSTFLEDLIADCNGISNPIRMFSSDQISKATNHSDPQWLGSFSEYFIGVIEGRSYAIKKLIYYRDKWEPESYKDIVISARVSNHSGFLKLKGCCLEFPYPVVVFEKPEYGVLNHGGSVGGEDEPLLPWNVRLKIAKEVAIAITYLHTAFPRIIIHRNINPKSVVLDKNWTAKLTNFSISVILPEGKTWVVDRVTGTLGYLDPVYYHSGIVTEYTDVYSFGILMLVLLTGIPALGPEGSILRYIKDLQERGETIEFGGDSNDMRLAGQMKMFLELALRCCEERIEDRPKMILVAKELKRIEKLLDC